MSQKSHTDISKEASKFIREQIPGTKSSHAHALIAHGLGFNNKKALIDSGILVGVEDEPEFMLEIEIDKEVIKSGCARMGDTPLKNQSTDLLARATYAALAPVCNVCNEKSMSIRPVGGDDHHAGEWLCDRCFTSNPEYGACIYCGPDQPYRLDDLNAQGECPAHDGESLLEPEEQEDWDSYLEYNTKDN